MRVGLQIMRFDWPGSPENIRVRLKEMACLADEVGFASLWVMDHFFQMGGAAGPPEAPMLEGYTTLGYMAGATERIRLGLMVTGNIYRHPGILVKTATTLDVLSGGRTYFGIGAGWYEREARGLGVPFPPLRERFDRLEETLLIAKLMWAGYTTPFRGRYYRLEEPLNSPKPLSQPHPPILIGGGGERRTLRLVAQYADACNLFAGNDRDHYAAGLETVKHKLGVLRGHCAEVGRSYNEIERTVLAGADVTDEGAAADVVEHCRRLADLGVQHAIFNLDAVHDLTPLEVFGREVIPMVAGFGAPT